MISGQENPFDLSHWVGHIVSAGTIVGYFAGWLPALAATVAFFWYLVQLYESDTAQHFFSTRRERKIAKLTLELARWQAKKLLHDQPIAPGTLADEGAYRLKSEGAPPGDAPPG